MKNDSYIKEKFEMGVGWIKKNCPVLLWLKVCFDILCFFVDCCSYMCILFVFYLQSKCWWKGANKPSERSNIIQVLFFYFNDLIKMETLQDKIYLLFKAIYLFLKEFDVLLYPITWWRSICQTFKVGIACFSK